MNWTLTEDDLTMMELENADRLINEPLPDWYDRDEDGDLSARWEADVGVDPDFQDRTHDAVNCWEEMEQLDKIAHDLWNVYSLQPIGTAETMLCVADRYLPPDGEDQVVPKQEIATPTAENLRNEGEPAKRVQPYEVAQELLEREVVLVSRNVVYYYDGKIYRIMTKEEMQRLIVEECRESVSIAGTTNLVEQVYKFIFLEPHISIRDIEPSPDEVVFLDGVLNLNTMGLEAYSPSSFSTRLVQAHYRRGTTMACPNFDRFVDDIANGDPDLARRVWQALGYLIVQDQRGKCFVLLQGVHDSGKSVLGRFVQSLFDQDTTSGLELHALDGNFSKSDLIGKSLWLDLDLPSGALRGRAASELKKITGGDLLSADIKYMPRASFVNRAKILFATNHPVLTDSADEAFERRMIVIPFARTIPQEEQDFDLDAKLQAEKDAVVAKAIRYFLNLRGNRYIFAGNFPANCAVSTGDDLVSKIFFFLSEYCTEGDGWTPTEVLYAAFSSTFGPVCSARSFAERLSLYYKSVYPRSGRKRERIDGKGNAVWGYTCIQLKAGVGEEVYHESQD